ncbi:SRPBCC family protein [Nocardioides sp.]|uniref:SRPBCC family protein n=1 Tax=Nocardioides sp. TaxID=35761 RepID=UPI0035B09D50
MEVSEGNRSFDRLVEVRLDVAAPPEVVWELVRDPRRMAEWSPQVRSSSLVEPDAAGDDRTIGVGTRFVNVNEEGADLQWTTHGEVVRLDPCREVAFRIEENWAVWSLTLEALADGGTRLVERRETPEGLSDLALDLTDAFMGGQRVFTRNLRAGMRETLLRIRDAAERASVTTARNGRGMGRTPRRVGG